MFVIFDLDGTLCKINHRLHYITGKHKNWDMFFKSCVYDEPNLPIINVLNSFLSVNTWCESHNRARPYRIEIWSGRSEIALEETIEWLERHSMSHMLLKHMRPERDYTPDDMLKKKWLDAENNKPDLVFDDRQRVVDMWRYNGITCCQVDAWKEKE